MSTDSFNELSTTPERVRSVSVDMPSAVMQLAPKMRLGPYQIVEVVGRGAMATVYKADQQTLRRFVALKVLSQELAADAPFVEGFRFEATLAANLEHPHIVPIYDVGQCNGCQYIAMRYIGGGTLASLL